MEEKQFNVVIDRLDKILRLQAIEVVKGLAKEQDKIELLDSLGFKSSEIDRLLGKSVGYSSVVLYQLKKKKLPRVPADQQTGTSLPQEVVT